MNRKTELLVRFSLVAILTAAPCMAGTYFETSWNMATGNSELALTDGYRFSNATGTNLLKVETGGIAGNNLMGIWLNGQQFGHCYVARLPIMDYDDFYYRFYLRVYPKTGISYPNFHGIENFENEKTGSTSDMSNNFYFSVRDQGNPNSWTFGMGTYAAQPEGMDNGYLFNGGLSFNQWYRVEGHIRWYSHAEWAAPTKWELKVYDANNNVVADENSLMGMTKGGSLASYYNQGKRLYIDGYTDSWSMGNNGPAGGTGQGRIHDISCVALGNDISVFGPVSAKMPTDNIKPTAVNFFPAANATNIAASTVVSVTLKDAGFGLDTSSIVLKVNGATVKPNRSGTKWNTQLFYKPAASFPAGAKVSVEVSARDLASPANAMTPVAYTFTIAGTAGIKRYSAHESPSVWSVPEKAAYNLLGQTISLRNGSSSGATRCLLIRDEKNGAGARKAMMVR